MVRKSPRRRMSGMTLVEIMAVVTIVGMIASAIGVNVARSMADDDATRTRADAARLDTIANAYLTAHGDARCPSVSHLGHVGALGDAARVDAWEHEFDIDCGDDGAHALSAGADGQFDTEDDITATTP